MCQTVSPFNTYTSTRSTLTLFSSHSRSTLHLYTNLQRSNTFSIKNNSFEQIKYFIHEHDQIENPILRNNLRVHRYHAHLEQPHITFSLDHNFYNKYPRTLILTVWSRSKGRDQIPTVSYSFGPCFDLCIRIICEESRKHVSSFPFLKQKHNAAMSSSNVTAPPSWRTCRRKSQNELRVARTAIDQGPHRSAHDRRRLSTSYRGLSANCCLSTSKNHGDSCHDWHVHYGGDWFCNTWGRIIDYSCHERIVRLCCTRGSGRWRPCCDSERLYRWGV